MLDMPLSQIKILDLSQLLPGPFCSQILADFGAEVVKVEIPQGGDHGRSYCPKVKKEGAAFLAINRNKKSLTLDLKKTEGRRLFKTLIKGFDVVIESYRPGFLKKLGIGYEQIRKIHPKIIYCSITAYGQTGPYRSRAGHDLNAVALAGILDMTGRGGGPPALPGIQIADIGAGLYAALAILMALTAKQRSGIGQHIDISMLDTAVSFLTIHAGNYFATGKPPERGEEILSGGFACYNLYPTKEGRYLSVAALEPHFWRDLCLTLRMESWVSKQFVPRAQPRIKRELSKIFRTKKRSEWLQMFLDSDLCIEPVFHMGETFSHPQVLRRKMLCCLSHPTEGKLPQLGIPIRLSETPGRVRFSPPVLGEHTGAIVKKLGYSPDRMRALKRKGII